MWDTPVPIFEDEDEDQLINEFVRLSALYPKYEPFQITQVVFKDLRDPIMRANQAAMVWSKDLEILERIRQARLDGPPDGVLIQSKEQWERKMLALLDDQTLNAQEKKVRREILDSIAKVKGWAEGDEDDKNNRRAVIMNFGVDPRSLPATDAA